MKNGHGTRKSGKESHLPLIRDRGATVVTGHSESHVDRQVMLRVKQRALGTWKNKTDKQNPPLTFLMPNSYHYYEEIV